MNYEWFKNRFAAGILLVGCWCHGVFSQDVSAANSLKPQLVNANLLLRAPTLMAPFDVSSSKRASVNPANPVGAEVRASPAGELSSSLDSSLHMTPVVAGSPVVSAQTEDKKNFEWRPALQQSFAFLVFEHAVRIAREPSTRKELPGKFWKDYCDSVLGLDGWRDGDPFYVNYVGHPMQGAVAGYIQIQNDPRGKNLEFGDPGYARSRSLAMAWTAAYSIQFELGPISEASIGNVGRGIDPRTGRSGAGAVDLVVTPTLGAAWLVAEDMTDRYLIRRLENTTRNRFLKSVYRGLLNPDRAMANMLAGKVPWHRDTRGPIWTKPLERPSQKATKNDVHDPSGSSSRTASALDWK